MYARSDARRPSRVSTSSQPPPCWHSSAISGPNSKSAPLSLYMLQSSCVWAGCTCQVAPLTGTADAYSLGAVRNDRVQTKNPASRTAHSTTLTIDTTRRNAEHLAFLFLPSIVDKFYGDCKNSLVTILSHAVPKRKRRAYFRIRTFQQFYCFKLLSALRFLHASYNCTTEKSSPPHANGNQSQPHACFSTAISIFPRASTR